VNLFVNADLLLAEFASLLARRTRRRRISGEQAVQAFELTGRWAPRLFDMRALLPSAIHLSRQLDIPTFPLICLDI
jgi:hypothetical protein